MNASYNDLRHQAVLPVDISEVTELSITLEGKDYLVTSEVSEEDDEEVRKFYLDGEELDVEALQNALTASPPTPSPTKRPAATRRSASR